MRTRSVITKALCGVSLAVALVAAGGAAAQAKQAEDVSTTDSVSWTKGVSPSASTDSVSWT